MIGLDSLDTLDLPAWMGDALCAQVDPDLFFPEKGGSAQPARRVCAACHVRPQCLQYALDEGIGEGIWGGTIREEREHLRAERRGQVAA